MTESEAIRSSNNRFRRFVNGLTSKFRVYRAMKKGRPFDRPICSSIEGRWRAQVVGGFLVRWLLGIAVEWIAAG